MAAKTSQECLVVLKISDEPGKFLTFCWSGFSGEQRLQATSRSFDPDHKHFPSCFIPGAFVRVLFFILPSCFLHTLLQNDAKNYCSFAFLPLADYMWRIFVNKKLQHSKPYLKLSFQQF
ncbi:hypothetical protein [uncultured Pontibacter sp.]|uniref:hypothetical protein n=1 Tax=uncultured Pontibacter sp. TaxID=453356 RepID=UPI0026292487|nr:hypothetical protein [uncultured Pontibacter sp.]